MASNEITTHKKNQAITNFMRKKIRPYYGSEKYHPLKIKKILKK